MIKEFQKKVFLTFIFLGFNDLILLGMNLLVIKHVFFAISIGLLLFTINKKQLLKVVLPVVFIISLTFIAYFQSKINNNSIDASQSDIFALLITLITPLIFALSANKFKSYKKNSFLQDVSICLLYAGLFATIHKILFVIFSHIYPNSSFLSYLFSDLHGRGEVDGLHRLNTGNQFLILLVLLLSVNLLLNKQKKYLCVISILMCFLNIYLTGSRFFSAISIVLLVIIFYKSLFKRKLFTTIAVFSGISIGYSFLTSERASLNPELFDFFYRLEQFNFLLESFQSNILVGKGSGLEINDLNYVMPWKFENETMVLFDKYGLLGAVFFLMTIHTTFLTISMNFSKSTYYILLLTIFISSVFNPYLFGTYSGIGFSMIYLISISFAMTPEEVNRKNAR